MEDQNMSRGVFVIVTSCKGGRILRGPEWMEGQPGWDVEFDLLAPCPSVKTTGIARYVGRREAMIRPGFWAHAWEYVAG